jgi:small subunit ribosomal protein S20
LAAGFLAAAIFRKTGCWLREFPLPWPRQREFDGFFMANTKSARKAARQIARRTEANKARRSALRGSVRKVEEAIAFGDRAAAAAALQAAEPTIMRAAQRGVVHKNNASRKVSRLAHRVAKLGK